ncbi:MAG: DUF4325 domain-containing protein [Abitibacteriaceae bacterium]|nr:DUF4325 domain-containing protein [Abditibacteriaceae bacterium]
MENVVMQSLGEYGTQLAMRPYGRKVQEALDSLLRRLPPGGVLVVNFDGVEMMDYSFADEAFGTLYSRMAAKEYADRYLVLAVRDDELSEALMENIEVALNRREVAALVLPQSMLVESYDAPPQGTAVADNPAGSSGSNGQDKPKWRVIGRLPEHLIETLSAVMEKQQVTVRDLVEALNLDSATACNNRIAKLYQLHLVRRKATIVPEGGRQYSYSAVV